MIPKTAQLSDLSAESLELVAEGGERYVYKSRDFPEFLFKKQKRVDERRLKKRDLKSFLLRVLPSYRTHIVRKEYRAYVSAVLRQQATWPDFPTTMLHGFTFLDGEPIQVVENVTLEGRDIGPSLRELLADDLFDAAALDALNVFGMALLRSDIPTNDVNASNIVLGSNRDGTRRFILVDGFGDIHLVPFRTYSSFVRKRHLVRLFSKLGKNRLAFDPKTFAFSLR
ncbi:YrbL family protein [Aliishimia ponticola]|uniref:YrbL family protein n=1 Tax=Aliishimia ponticola TaxID=2499833 RepID=UPI001455F3FE|nr:YrbL family protein [Aliishimia ponticola]